MEGTPFGRYQLLELLGRGGMGEVWRAYDPTLNRVVALKVLPPNFADDQVFQERFRREARAAAGLDEPHVVPFHDFGEVEGRLYVTMRLINGRDLQALLVDAPLPPARAVNIIEQIAFALDAAHRVGLVHRDVKPSNILVGEHDFAYLIDFGIARTAGETGLTNTGAAIGTWAYMSPERLNTGHADARADIYALACVLHEALTGRRPYPGNSLEQQIVGHLTTPPPRPSTLNPNVPAAFDDVIATGMAKGPDLRYQTTKALAQAARAALATPLHHSGTPTPPAAAPTRKADTVGIRNVPTQRGPAFASSDLVSFAYPAPPEDPTRPHRRNRRTTFLIGSAAVLAVVAVAAIAIVVGTRSSKETGDASPESTVEPTSATTTTTSPRGPATTAPAGPEQRLMALVPADANCTVYPRTYEPQAVASATCTGVSFARAMDYTLYQDQASLDASFDLGISVALELVSCPGMGPSPQQWHRAGNPQQIEGRVGCQVNDFGEPIITWTINSQLLEGVLIGNKGATIDQVYQWWKTHYQ